MNSSRIRKEEKKLFGLFNSHRTKIEDQLDATIQEIKEKFHLDKEKITLVNEEGYSLVEELIKEKQQLKELKKLKENDYRINLSETEENFLFFCYKKWFEINGEKITSINCVVVARISADRERCFLHLTQTKVLSLGIGEEELVKKMIRYIIQKTFFLAEEKIKFLPGDIDDEEEFLEDMEWEANPDDNQGQDETNFDEEKNTANSSEEEYEVNFNEEEDDDDEEEYYGKRGEMPDNGAREKPFKSLQYNNPKEEIFLPRVEKKIQELRALYKTLEGRIKKSHPLIRAIKKTIQPSNYLLCAIKNLIDIDLIKMIINFCDISIPMTRHEPRLEKECHAIEIAFIYKHDQFINFYFQEYFKDTLKEEYIIFIKNVFNNLRYRVKNGLYKEAAENFILRCIEYFDSEINQSQLKELSNLKNKDVSVIEKCSTIDYFLKQKKYNAAAIFLNMLISDEKKDLSKNFNVVIEAARDNNSTLTIALIVLIDSEINPDFFSKGSQAVFEVVFKKIWAQILNEREAFFSLIKVLYGMGDHELIKILIPSYFYYVLKLGDDKLLREFMTHYVTILSVSDLSISYEYVPYSEIKEILINRKWFDLGRLFSFAHIEYATLLDNEEKLSEEIGYHSLVFIGQSSQFKDTFSDAKLDFIIRLSCLPAAEKNVTLRILIINYFQHVLNGNQKEQIEYIIKGYEKKKENIYSNIFLIDSIISVLEKASFIHYSRRILLSQASYLGRNKNKDEERFYRLKEKLLDSQYLETPVLCLGGEESAHDMAEILNASKEYENTNLILNPFITFAIDQYHSNSDRSSKTRIKILYPLFKLNAHTLVKQGKEINFIKELIDNNIHDDFELSLTIQELISVSMSFGGGLAHENTAVLIDSQAHILKKKKKDLINSFINNVMNKLPCDRQKIIFALECIELGFQENFKELSDQLLYQIKEGYGLEIVKTATEHNLLFSYLINLFKKITKSDQDILYYSQISRLLQELIFTELQEKNDVKVNDLIRYQKLILELQKSRDISDKSFFEAVTSKIQDIKDSEIMFKAIYLEFSNSNANEILQELIDKNLDGILIDSDKVFDYFLNVLILVNKKETNLAISLIIQKIILVELKRGGNNRVATLISLQKKILTNREDQSYFIGDMKSKLRDLPERMIFEVISLRFTYDQLGNFDDAGKEKYLLGILSSNQLLDNYGLINLLINEVNDHSSLIDKIILLLLFQYEKNIVLTFKMILLCWSKRYGVHELVNEYIQMVFKEENLEAFLKSSKPLLNETHRSINNLIIFFKMKIHFKEKNIVDLNKLIVGSLLTEYQHQPNQGKIVRDPKASFLHFAVLLNDEEFVSYYINYYINNVKVIFEINLFDEVDENKNSPFFLAIQRGNAALVKTILDHTNVNLLALNGKQENVIGLIEKTNFKDLLIKDIVNRWVHQFFISKWDKKENILDEEKNYINGLMEEYQFNVDYSYDNSSTTRAYATSCYTLFHSTEAKFYTKENAPLRMRFTNSPYSPGSSYQIKENEEIPSSPPLQWSYKPEGL